MNLMRNPMLLLVWGLPAVAVLASVTSLLLTIRAPEGELPEQYHWEGFQLDRDFSQAAHATELGVQVTITGFDSGGRCELKLRTKGSLPQTLILHVAHATKAALDQHVEFHRVANSPNAYSGPCVSAPDGHWRLELVDAANGWAIRQTERGGLGTVVLDAVASRNE
jgi:hypothetical protein